MQYNVMNVIKYFFDIRLDQRIARVIERLNDCRVSHSTLRELDEAFFGTNSCCVSCIREKQTHGSRGGPKSGAS